MNRPTWDETWMRTAEIVAQRSVCAGRKVGAAIAGPTNRYLCTGYNSPPAGFDHGDLDCSTWCVRQQTDVRGTTYEGCPSVHAETNAIIQADRHLIEGGTLYVTSACCWDCGKIVANSGVFRVVMQVDWERDAHRNPQTTIDFLKDCGLKVDLWQDRSITFSSTSSSLSTTLSPSSPGLVNDVVSSE